MSFNQVKFSVSVCVYKNDDPQHFKEAVESILTQTLMPDEIVLVVDGPIYDELDEIVKRYEKTSLFNVIRLPENVGHGLARNISVKNAKHEYIAIMDADDISIQNRFELQIKHLSSNPNISVLGGYIAEFIDNTNNIVGIRKVEIGDQNIKLDMKKRCPFNQLSVIFKKSEVEAAGGYLDWHYEEDYYLWIRMFQNGSTFENLDVILAYARVGKEMYQRRGGWKYFKSERKLQKYMRKHKIIGFWRYLINVNVRFIVQVLMPNWLRGIVFRKFARKTA